MAEILAEPHMDTSIFPPLSLARREAIRAQWQRFQSGLQVDGSIVRDVILRSWQRCRGRGFCCRSIQLGDIDARALAMARDKNRDLVESAARLMDKLVLSIHMSNSVVTLVDDTGMVLHAAATYQDLESIPYGKPGRMCDEVTLGTNGMGLCVIEKRPVHVIGSEHFNASLHHLSCTAAPIFNGQGQLAGAINLAICTEKLHQHTLGLVEAAAHAVEEQMRLRSLLSEQKVILEVLDEGVVVLDADGRICTINGQACAMLQVDAAAIGQTIQAFVPSGHDILSAISSQAPFVDRELTLPLSNGVLQCALSVVPFGEGGVVLTLRETRRMRSYAAKVAGAKAVYTFGNILGESRALQESLKLARIAARSDATTLILGESGTGKELFAQAIHNASRRRSGPFVVVNCGALPRTLVQSELFGYVAGAFSGALKEGSPGKFELADGGTIFLDEIGEMPLEAQVSLLRLLQESEVTRLGGKQAKRIDVRILAATNKDLLAAVKLNAFRGDLYYRLNVLAITVPPLRQREADVRLLTRRFLDKFAASLGKRRLDMTPEAMEAMAVYAWPGNVRELENVVERLAHLAQHDCIDLDDLPRDITGAPAEVTVAAAQPAGMSLHRLQKNLILDTLRQTKGNCRRASSLLNISRTTLYARLREYDLCAADFR